MPQNAEDFGQDANRNRIASVMAGGAKDVLQFRAQRFQCLILRTHVIRNVFANKIGGI